jgi:hypothetical protein
MMISTLSPTRMRALGHAVLRLMAVALALAGCARGGTAQAAARTVAAITADDLTSRVHIFADDSMQGRAAGSRGHQRAIAYIVQELTRLGLEPAGDRDSFYQRVPIPEGMGDTTWSHNVVALLEGSDPMLRTQYVALGAHSDHIGIKDQPVDHALTRAINRAVWQRRGRAAGTPSLSLREQAHVEDSVRDAWKRRRPAPRRLDSIFNGADDDGSGSMALLEIAEYLAAQPARPKRSILFVWHTGEELGLNGSEWYVAHPTVPLNRIVAQINVDMIGRGSAKDITGGGESYLGVLGARRQSSEFARWVESVNAAQARPLVLDYSLDADGHPEGLFCRSDHASYARQGIPIVFLFTNIHEDYHEVTDEPAYLDYPHFARVTSYIAALAKKAGDNTSPPAIDRPKPHPRAPCRQ